MKEKDFPNKKTEDILALNRGEDTLFQRRENLQRHASYASERRQYDAIRNGQVEQIYSVMRKKPDGTPGVLSKNELHLRCVNMEALITAGRLTEL